MLIKSTKYLLFCLRKYAYPLYFQLFTVRKQRIDIFFPMTSILHLKINFS